MNSPSPGHCFPHSKLPSTRSSSCDSSSLNGNDNNNANLSCFADTERHYRYRLTARDVVTEDSVLCASDRDCDNHQLCLFFIFESTTDEQRLSSTVPLVSQEKLTRLLVKNKRFILFAGHPSELWNAVEIDEYVPRKLLQVVELPCWVPSRIKTFLVYLASLSSALGLINIAPIFHLDGHWVVSALVKWSILLLHPPPHHTNNINNNIATNSTDTPGWSRSVLTCGTFLLASNIFLSLLKMILS
eukprot:TRINITY_DN5082_c0_g1_i2.p1 TRINITY_DN5082_c0_g1~~TRINITY_DN5082_c0_g1_i2.p1  ORF type:complete len:244 (-),score=54.63 TRINITY_DN5082_c0_g1_i2:82-813(-)